VLVLAGRGGDDGPAAPAPSSSTAPADSSSTLPPGPIEAGWTVLVYMIADNDLEPFALDDLDEIATVPSGADLELLVLVDRSDEYDDSPVPGVGSFTSTKLLRSEAGGLVELADWGERNLGDPATLAEFVDTGLSMAPGRRTALIIWDHGGGWTGIGPDMSHGDVLEIGQIRQALDDAVIGGGHRPLDLLGFDACLMATVEVAVTMAPVADLMLASAELEPGHGWDFTALDLLATGPVEPEALGQHLAEAYQAHADGFGTGYDITLSLVDLRAMDDLETAMTSLTDELADDITAIAPTVGILRPVALSFGRSPDPRLDSHLVDLGDVLEELAAASPAASGRVAEVTAVLDRAVVADVSGPATRRASGLSIYFPPYREFFDPGYTVVDALPAWSRFLDAYYGAGEAIPADQQAQFVRRVAGDAGDGSGSGGAAGQVEVDHFFDEDGLNMIATLDPAAAANVADATIFYGVPLGDGSVVFYGEEPGVVLTDGSGLAGAIYDLTILKIDDGFDTVDAYIALTWDEESGLATFDIPMAYQAPGTGPDQWVDVILRLVVDGEGTVLSETYYVVNASGSYGELTADPRGLMFPLALKEAPDGTTSWVPTSDVGLFASIPELQYEFVPLESGTTLDARLRIRDFGGNTDVAGIQVVIP